MHNLNLSLLRTLIAICDEESFARAALRVHKSQPAISQQMSKLEGELSITIFEKKGRKKTLTPAGIRLVEYARKILTLHDEMWAIMHDEELIGPVRIGAPPEIADTILPHILQRFARANAKLSFLINVGRSPELMDMLEAGALDLTISTKEYGNFPHHLLRTSPTVWIAAKNYDFDPKQVISLIVADESSLSRQICLTALNEGNYQYKETYTAPTLEGIRAAVRSGLGITARSIEVANASEELKILGSEYGLPPLPNIDYYLYLQDRGIPNPTAKKLYQLLISQLNKYPIES